LFDRDHDPFLAHDHGLCPDRGNHGHGHDLAHARDHGLYNLDYRATDCGSKLQDRKSIFYWTRNPQHGYRTAFPASVVVAVAIGTIALVEIVFEKSVVVVVAAAVELQRLEHSDRPLPAYTD
jgi:hypothetical protein